MPVRQVNIRTRLSISSLEMKGLARSHTAVSDTPENSKQLNNVDRQCPPLASSLEGIFTEPPALSHCIKAL